MIEQIRRARSELAAIGLRHNLVVARAVRNPYLRKSINQTREPLFAAA